MMRNKNRHLFLKYTYNFNNTDIISIDEHVKVDLEKGTVIWGQFTGNSKANNFEANKIKILDKQIDEGIPTFVFFFCGEKKQLHVAEYMKRYSRYEIMENSEDIELIPGYYHHLVGKDPDGTPSCKAYVKVKNITQIDVENLDKIIQFDKERTMFDRISERFNTAYVNTEESFYSELVNMTQKKMEISIDKKTLNVLEEIEYQDNVERIKIEGTINFDDNPEKVDNKKVGQQSGRWNRNSTKAKRVIVYNSYKCEFDDNHNYFISNVTKENYVEAHHLIPMEFQDKFIPVSLDVEANIVSLCVVCHKKLHHSTYNVKEEIVKKIYDERRNRLEKCGINIKLEDLLNLYK